MRISGALQPYHRTSQVVYRACAALRTRWPTTLEQQRFFALGYVHRAPHEVGSGGLSGEAEMISPDLIVIEEMEEPGSSAAGGCRGGGARSMFPDEALGADSNDDDCGGLAFTDVVAVDTFAKSKILNYIGRFSPRSSSHPPRGAGAGGGSSLPLQSMTREEGAGGVTVFRARLRLPVPFPLKEPIAEGIGESEKDAEVLVAMHAERVLDAMGVPLFQLPSKQKRHAEAARAQGRHAPLPGDPFVRDPRVPPPLRMVTAALRRGGGSGNGWRDDPASRYSASSTTTEAEVVVGGGADREPSSNLGVLSTKPDDAGDGSSGGGLQGERGQEPIGSTGSTPSLRQQQQQQQQGALFEQSGSLFDPTEGGAWQMVNTTSQRFSPSDLALLLPCVFDKASRGRVEDYFQGLGMDMRAATGVKHVMVPGYGTRMFLCEIVLDADDGLVARGKGHDRDYALYLACMHAEILIDATGRALFPADAAKQHAHAELVRGYGRWAMDPVTGERSPPPELAEPDLPQPLKQQSGGDETLLIDERLALSNRSAAERLIMTHNELANRHVADFVEVLPTPEVMEEAPRILKAWARHHKHRFAELFVTTRMGDYVRASYILPLPEYVGVRGGNGVGRTPQQAIELCALHALDTLNVCNVEVFPADPERQARYVEERKRLGLCVPRGPLLPKTSSGVRHLPGYYVDPGNAPRALPNTDDVMRVATLRPLEDFELLAMSESDILTRGVETKTLVQTYLRQMTGEANVQSSAFFTGFAKVGNVHTICFLPLLLPEYCVAGIEDAEERQRGRRQLAVGGSMKKKDADRCCFLHAAAILRAFGVDPKNSVVLGKKQRKRLESALGSGSSSSSSRTIAGADAANGGASMPPHAAAAEEGMRGQDKGTADAASPAPSRLPSIPKPFMHPQMFNNLTNQEKERAAILQARSSRRPFSNRIV